MRVLCVVGACLVPMAPYFVSHVSRAAGESRASVSVDGSDLPTVVVKLTRWVGSVGVWVCV